MRYASEIRDCLDALLIEASAEDIARDFHASALFNNLNKKLKIAYELDDMSYDNSIYESLVLEYPRHSLKLFALKMKEQKIRKKRAKLFKKLYN